MIKRKSKRTVVCQLWEKTKNGWHIDDDGYSLHLNETDCQQFIDEHIRSDVDDGTVAYVSRPCGDPYQCDIFSTHYIEIRNTKNGKRFRGIPPR